jgi:hypothetical protein
MGAHLQAEVAQDMLSRFNLIEVLDDDAGSKQVVVLGR